MPAAAQQLEQPVVVDVIGDVVVERRKRAREPMRQVVKTAPAGTDRHIHCVIFVGDDGEGFTSAAPDGHIHNVHALELLAVRGHTHELSAMRCPEQHDRLTGKHVQARR